MTVETQYKREEQRQYTLKTTYITEEIQNIVNSSNILSCASCPNKFCSENNFIFLYVSLWKRHWAYLFYIGVIVSCRLSKIYKIVIALCWISLDVEACLESAIRCIWHHVIRPFSSFINDLWSIVIIFIIKISIKCECYIIVLGNKSFLLLFSAKTIFSFTFF